MSNPTEPATTGGDAGATRVGTAAGAPPAVETPTPSRPQFRGRQRSSANDAIGDERRSVLRIPKVSPMASFLGWILAWGAIAIATASLGRAGVGTGFGLGLADGGPGDNRLPAGLWLLVVSGCAFLLGGYGAARMARANGTSHGIALWVVAMIATGVDAIIDTIRDGNVGVVRLIPGAPYWAETGLSGRGEAVVVLTLFALVALIGAFIGGALGQVANRVDRTDDVIVRT